MLIVAVVHGDGSHAVCWRDPVSQADVVGELRLMTDRMARDAESGAPATAGQQDDPVVAATLAPQSRFVTGSAFYDRPRGRAEADHEGHAGARHRTRRRARYPR